MRNILASSVRRRQRGTTLLEALVAFLVLSLGMLTVARMQTQLRNNADVARQRSEAVRLAQEDLELLRSFAVLAVSAGQRSYDAIESSVRSLDADAGLAGGTRYQIARQIDTGSAPRSKNTSVTVSWTDRNGNPQQVALNSVIGGVDPAYSGALGLVRSSAALTKGPLGRSIAIPVSAKDLGNGTSALKPTRTATTALLFDNASGALLGRCTGLAAGTASRELTTADLSRCDTSGGVLLSGAVRFAANAVGASGDALPPLSIALALTGGTYASAPECTTEALKTVSFTAAGSLHIEAVPLADGSPSGTDTGERYVAYQCVVHPLTNGQWSGSVTLAPSGWSIGSGAADRRVCRYVSDVDASGSIDANIEHPAAYSAVSGALAHQDFLVINGADACPDGRASAGTATPSTLASATTVQLQP